MTSHRRLFFGYNKYAALNMLVAKWLRFFAASEPYWYVTLGGTELTDVANVSWIDNELTSKVLTYEQDPIKYQLANEIAIRFKSKGIDAAAIRDDIFNYRREGTSPPHIFYMDFLDVCSAKSYAREFKVWFENDVIRPGDLLLITSYLGRNPGWQRVLKQYDSEFRILRVDTLQGQKNIYEVMHPLFVLFRGLIEAGLNNELTLRCFGSVKYRDSSTMGIYGIICEEKMDDRVGLMSALTNASFFNSMIPDWQSF